MTDLTDLTDRMRTCAARIASITDPARNDHSINDAVTLLIEASNIIEAAAPPPVPMEIIPPVAAPLTKKEDWSLDTQGAWVAAGDTLPVANPYRSQNACPTCDSRAPKRVRRAGNGLVLVCPVCGLITKKPPAEGTPGGQD